MHPLADHRRQLPIERLGETLDAAPGFCLVVSYNPGYQSVLKDLKDSTRQRMVAIDFGFPTADVEEKILANEAGIGAERAAELVRLGQAIRRLETGGLREVASTRVLIAAGRLIAEGLSPRDAARAAIAGPLTDDSTVTRGLVEMIDVYLGADQRAMPHARSERILGPAHPTEVGMSYESTAEPIKVGYLMDFTLPPGFPEDLFASFTQTFDLIFEEAVEQGLMDRPVQMIYREVEGLPKGSVKAVIDAYGELVDEGCLVVFGPNITDNCVPVREAIEERFKVPAISVTGTDDWLGEWTFAFPQGSMTDEPIFLADLVAKRGLTEIGVLVEQSLIGESYLKNLRSACRRKGIRIVAEVEIAQTAQDINAAVQTLHEAKAEAIVHLGFGFGIVFINPALESARLGPAPVHHHRVPERLGQPDHVERVHGLDRRRPVRRGQPDRTETSWTSTPRSTTAVVPSSA